MSLMPSNRKLFIICFLAILVILTLSLFGCTSYPATPDLGKDGPRWVPSGVESPLDGVMYTVTIIDSITGFEYLIIIIPDQGTAIVRVR